MFTGKSLLKMSDYCFLMSEEDKRNCEVISKKSSQHWHIVECLGKYRLYRANKYEYKVIGDYVNMLECMFEIEEMDALEIKKQRQKKKRQNFLNRMLEKYINKPILFNI
ncbi:hypothetical protein [Butyrivibrio sp. VCB2006]|uniref:hypothetical protein n=1 Tax=Butyrivibrio sp. VCB2006 TaxID=1280679 RepID=UPI00040AE50D|nr:hypothetical protein [Butyrivibrio sp. VCB2006]